MLLEPTAVQNISEATEINGRKVTPIPRDGLIDFVQTLISKKKECSEPFYVLDLGTVVTLMEKWKHHLPNISPFYAVKCNPEPAFLSVMAALGANFDCASQVEIETILSLGVSPDRIIYANPCKAETHIKYSASVGVSLTTFDSKEEIDKIKKFHPQCSLLIRIKADDCGARRALGSKYGALEEEFEPLLLSAQAAKLDVIGVSFHIGSGATNANIYRNAIGTTKLIFEMAIKLGLAPMHMLDIGGGFTNGLFFEEAVNTIKYALDDYFGNVSGLIVIAEPGRFFAESPFTLATNIIGKRVRGEEREYWNNDGIYGSMSCILNGHGELPMPIPLVSETRKDESANGDGDYMRTYNTKVFGPTCDALDIVVKYQQLPELFINDWIVFKNMGAYMAAMGTNFNGFISSNHVTYLVYSDNTE